LSIKSDRWIRRMAQEHGMLEPFEPGQVKQVNGERMAAHYGVPLLGSLPLDAAIREQGDAGTPVVAARPDSPLAAQWRAVAARLVAELEKRPRAPAGIDLSLRG
jgi:ATP-binding protein involved in chromosome partitioning